MTTTLTWKKRTESAGCVAFRYFSSLFESADSATSKMYKSGLSLEYSCKVLGAILLSVKENGLGGRSWQSVVLDLCMYT